MFKEARVVGLAGSLTSIRSKPEVSATHATLPLTETALALSGVSTEPRMAGPRRSLTSIDCRPKDPSAT
jgi:hypothetical protein